MKVQTIKNKDPGWLFFGKKQVIPAITQKFPALRVSRDNLHILQYLLFHSNLLQ